MWRHCLWPKFARNESPVPYNVQAGKSSRSANFGGKSAHPEFYNFLNSPKRRILEIRRFNFLFYPAIRHYSWQSISSNLSGNGQCQCRWHSRQKNFWIHYKIHRSIFLVCSKFQLNFLLLQAISLPNEIDECKIRCEFRLWIYLFIHSDFE